VEKVFQIFYSIQFSVIEGENYGNVATCSIHFFDCRELEREFPSTYSMKVKYVIEDLERETVPY